MLATSAVLSVASDAVAAGPDDAGSSATPAQREEAKTHYTNGVDLFNEGDYRGALVEFKRSYELVPNFNILYNIGQTHYQLQDYASALTVLSRYLTEGGARITKTRREEVEADVDKLKARVSTVTVKVNEKGATIFVDDVEVGVSPLPGPITVGTGRRTFRAKKEGFQPDDQVEDIAGQGQKEIVLELLPATQVIREIGPDGKPRIVVVNDPGPPIVPIVMWSLTGAIGIVGGIALTKDSKLAELKTTAGHTEEELNDAATSTRTLAIVTDVLLGATIVSAGVATYFTIDAVLSEPSPTPTDESGPPAPEVVLRVGPGFTGLVGTF